MDLKLRRAIDRSSARTVLAFVALFVAASFAGAGTYRLSQGLPFSGVLDEFELSPDGRYAVYSHDAVVDGAYELWSVPVAGGDPVRLSGLLPAGGHIAHFAISADSARVIFVSAQETAQKDELYSIAIGGPEGSWTKLSGSLPADSDVKFAHISPDSAHVVYQVQRGDNLDDVWTVPIAGGTPIRLRPTVVAAGSTAAPWGSIQISPDSQRVLFEADFNEVLRIELWSARVDGTGNTTRINGVLVDDGDVGNDFRISDDSARAVYIADQNVVNTFELFSVPIAGGAAVQLNGALVNFGAVTGFEIAPGSSRVVYRASQQTQGVQELYSVPIAGGGAAKVSGPMIDGGDVSTFAIAPDGGRVVYRADQQTDEAVEIYSAPILGGSWVKLNAILPILGQVTGFRIAPDSSRVVYRADQRVHQQLELFSIPLAGGTRVRVSDDPVTGGDVIDYRISPTSDSVAYIADLDTDEKFELFRAAIASTAHADLLLSGAMIDDGDVQFPGVTSALLLHPDGRQVIYRADAASEDKIDLYVGDPCLLCDGFEAGFVARWD